MSDNDRALAHGRERRVQAAPVFVEEDGTDQYEVDDMEGLRAMRARRPTADRVTKLEDKMDKVIPGLAAVGSKVDTLLQITSEERDARMAREKRELEARDKASERRWRHTAPIITAIGAAIAAVVAAIVATLGR